MSEKTESMIEMARAFDAWRVFPRIFISTYIYLLYQSVMWFMSLPTPSMEQAGLISIMTGVGAAWFQSYCSTSKKFKDTNNDGIPD